MNEQVSQSTIFDAIAAGEAAQAGMALAAANNGQVLEFAKKYAVELGRKQTFVTADDVQRVLIEKGFREHDLGNAAGSVFKNRKLWRWDGIRTVKSERVSSHGRLIRVWEYIGQ
jgi:hypothetical protein